MLTADALRARLALLPGRRCTLTSLVFWARQQGESHEAAGPVVLKLCTELVMAGWVDVRGTGQGRVVSLRATKGRPIPAEPAPSAPSEPPPASRPRTRGVQHATPQRAVERALERGWSFDD